MALTIQEVQAKQQALDAHITSLVKVKDQLYTLGAQRDGLFAELKQAQLEHSRHPHTQGEAATMSTYEMAKTRECEANLTRIQTELDLNEEAVNSLCDGQGF